MKLAVNAILVGLALTACHHDETVRLDEPVPTPAARSEVGAQPVHEHVVVTPEAAALDPVAVATVDEAPTVAAPDNTRRNVVDRQATITAADQSNARGDIRITAAIRRGVVRHAGMSTDGKNVKVITRAGRVTLRGPVASEEERRFVGDLARRTSGVAEVDDQLTVKAH